MEIKAPVACLAKLWRTFCCAACCTLLASACAPHRDLTTRADPAFSNPSDNKATLVVSRDAAGVCGTSLVRILVDSEYAGDVGPGETLQLYVAPGIHLIGIIANARCYPDMVSRYVTAAASQAIKIEVGFDFVGHIRFVE